MTDRGPVAVALDVPPEALDRLAHALAPQVAELLARERGPEPAGDGYLTPAGAARYLGVARKRIYDLTSARAIVPDGRDGRTPLYRRETLDAYVRRAA